MREKKKGRETLVHMFQKGRREGFNAIGRNISTQSKPKSSCSKGKRRTSPYK